jgi:hypothetical protein
MYIYYLLLIMQHSLMRLIKYKNSLHVVYSEGGHLLTFTDHTLH